MRRQDRERRRGTVHARQQIERIRVDHQRLAALERPHEQRARPVRAPHARTDRDHIRAREQLPEARGVRDRVADQLGSAGDDAEQVLARGRNGDEPGAHAQARFTGQSHGPRHPRTAADDQHAAELPLVRFAASRRQRVRDIRIAELLEQRTEARLVRRRDLQVIEHEPPGELGAGPRNRPVFNATKLIVQSARTAAPITAPVSALSPEGTSSASTGSASALIA